MSVTVPLVEGLHFSGPNRSVQCRQVATDRTTKFLYKTIKHLVLLYIICYNIFVDYKYESGNNCYIINTVVHYLILQFLTLVYFFFLAHFVWVGSAVWLFCVSVSCFFLFCADSSSIGLRSAAAESSCTAEITV